MAVREKSKRGFIRSVKDCINGLGFIMLNESNFKREILLAICTLMASYVLNVSEMEFVMILFAMALVFVSEIFNTAIEKVVDLYTREYNDIARIVKDVSAFGVLTACIFTLAIGIVIFVPKIISLMEVIS